MSLERQFKAGARTQGRATFTNIHRQTISQIREFKKFAASQSSQIMAKSGSGAGMASSVGFGAAFKLMQAPAAMSTSIQYSSRGTGKGISDMKAGQRMALGGPPLYKMASPGKPIVVNRKFRKEPPQLAGSPVVNQMMQEQYYASEAKFQNKASRKNGRLPQLGGPRHVGLADTHQSTHTKGGSSTTGRPYGGRATTGGGRSIPSREGPHEAHRRMVLSVQRQQLMDAGSQHPPSFN